ncbi:Fe(3+)-hydroxamate ABC transporter permease FhuB [Shewanella fidelis]|uniref:Fe(3+)-hydroxamate ABC transporter permease FhuB n=1 Tax=Shewanella fidelis TaxID=173509 RepID=A0AAW8NTE5_9GAMM|nr:Fe(3+)-hydroxamate ABC transporter permease FhuB [Shewanella fidelis]MDR8526111.1 Fe(3+)-hydroxamate ABC transporter permease FhuB [Shewanella fidelis]MDW4813724.1 Fe(3+)-hydroxamate ABC transporter permease FhuB [Shewanella fidelis]MDW4817820.1 Fe(3+)-hydroxamate ABC transporter permease FhuB [Shewanella fidelis]MDW4821919.1 Fe(3+)-hydroxamate ABC transporter permease FhuB [Shewanella fidelis]MDW4826052.1 Fe(3+)-hydroxamate ABC transporter permease FhuB [Shewanella fidelis]
MLTNTTIRYGIVLITLLFFAIFSAQIDTQMSLGQQWQLLFNFSERLQLATTFDGIMFVEAQLPRIVMAILVGGSLGLVGSLMQQLTQNPLVSPMTLGTASGAWLALVLLNVFFPALVGDYASLAATVGAMLTLVLVIMIAGVKNLAGLPVVLAGMAVNILLGAVATAVILLNDQYAKNLFIWGAGDLAQNGWQQVQWLLPKLSVFLVILVVAPRILALLRMGQAGAAARGLNIIPAILGLFAVGIWLVAVSITTVGVISFIGLLAPNIARHLGARTPKDELVFSMLLGATLLLITDALALLMGMYTFDLVPSGTAAALIGAPALIWFTRRRMTAADQMSFSLPKSRYQMQGHNLIAMLVVLVMLVSLSLVFNQITVNETSYWLWSLPNEFIWQIQWPRLLTSIAAGSGLAVAGVLLQRLIYNPLASPDILGISAGATCALVAGSIFIGLNIFDAAPAIAFMGSMIVLGLLLLLGKRHRYAPSMLILIGIALTALIDAMVQFALARGDETSYTILSWLAGSTYRVSPHSALLLLIGVVLLIIFAVVTSRWLTLISTGREFAKARGLNVPKAFMLLLCCVALLCGIVTATMGPVAFVGLLAPHMAVIMGAKTVELQLPAAAMIGAALLVVSDWLGQNIVYPSQIAAGTVVAVVGGLYFILLLLQGRKTASNC